MRYLTLVEYIPEDMEKVWNTYDESSTLHEMAPDNCLKDTKSSEDLL